MLAFRGELDQGAVVEVADGNAPRCVAALLQQPAQIFASVAQLLAELAVGNLEAAHGRPALFSVACGCGTQFTFQTGDFDAGRTDLLVQSPALRVRDGARWIL